MAWTALNPRWTDWREKRVWLVGASSGIGAALARALLARGAWVALSARRAEALKAVAGDHATALLLPMDATDPDAWRLAHDTLREAWEGVDLVVFCAADYRALRPWELEAASVRHTIETNLNSVYYGLQATLADMLARGRGSLVLVASVAGYMGLPNATVYGPTKAALINLAELLYAELHPRGLGVYLVNPGFVKTRLTANNAFPMPALLTPEAAAEAILLGLARGRFEIDFPRRFTLLLKLASLLPYRLRLAALQKVMDAP
ncbi:SDR family NAD(P)-dependent oxidoreductase [Cupriavidus basilensis]|uniref:SDR family NAD(P)-dependent oxidoreductase n=1 Tax=Cupriavidus basilensis TaxID=68895 RepID=UPI0020A6920E|nr:SDR family NAD(P)-dependent oxidoreductase [Cupriavidus basilensis]MCP3022448.1 SDR family NAD(P)-dependent oxidoreductase [Cupriavidus basilensis]